MKPLLIRMVGIRKSFNGTEVLHGVDFELAGGEVHALVGSNGAGKSTLMKILEGVHTPDDGVVEIDGRAVNLRSPQAARAHGIAMVFQEFSLIPTLTVAQNVFLTREPLRSGLLDDRESERQAGVLFAELGVSVDTREVLANLNTGLRQLTEIVKALAQNARVIIMDEPTSSLTRTETEALFKVIRTLRDKGISIVYISHRLDEIFEIADRITVLRDGRRVLSEAVSEVTPERVVAAIAGREVGAVPLAAEPGSRRSGTPLLELRDVRSGRKVKGVSLTLYPGEVVGIAGLMGSGRTELARAITGVERIDGGSILIRGKEVRIRDTADALAAQVCLVPEDRRTQGLVVNHNVKENLLLPVFGRLRRWGLIDEAAGDSLARSYVDRLRIVTDSLAKPVRLLSGGNQQKVVIGKWLAFQPDILIMDEPTAGIDIVTKMEILGIARELADSGRGVILISSELGELLTISDRILIMRDGRIQAEVDRNSVPHEGALHRLVQGA